MDEQYSQGAIARKLIIFVVTFSVLITLLTTAIQAYFEYDKDTESIDRRLQQAEASYRQSLSATVWVADWTQLSIMLEGILHLPDIVRARVLGPDGTVLASEGPNTVVDSVERTFPITYRHRGEDRQIGKMVVTASLSDARRRLTDRVLGILLSNALQTFAVAIFIFFAFSFLVTRHLGALADYARRLTPGRLDEGLVLDRSQRRLGQHDELDDLVDAINEMRERLRGSYRAMEESETRFRQLAENIREVFWIGSADWRKVYYISPLFEEVWGRPVAVAYQDSRAWMSNVHPDDAARVQREVSRLKETDCADPTVPEFRIVRPDGGVRWIRARAFPVFDEHGVMVRVAGIAEDVTQRRVADEAVRESERRYRSIVETTAEGYWLIDSGGRTLEVNDALCRMLGYGRDELLDRKPIEFVADHAQVGFKQAFGHQSKAINVQYETVYKAKDGHDVPAKLSASTLFGDDGEPVGAFAFITDITDQRRTNDELRRMHTELERRVDERTRELQIARNRAVAADRAKSEFLANMSHELRTPLNAVIGFSDVIIQRVFGNIGNPRYDEYIRLINESGIHLLELISDLLDVSAIEAGRMDMHEEEVNVVDVVESCMRLIRDRANKANVRIESRVPKTALVVRADGRRLKQIVINLLTNAVKFTGEGGTVTIEAEAVADGGLFIRVGDTGMGMDEAELKAVLMPFTRTQAATESHVEGTGLGLPLVKGLVEAHGGDFTLVSEKGVGTTATVHLPADRVVSS